MEIVTNALSELAKTGDVNHRNITSTIDIGQETIFQLPPVPRELRHQTSNVVTQRSSFLADDGAAVANAAALTTTVTVFGRGLWRIIISYNYLSNYVGNVGTNEFTLFLVDPRLQQNFLLGLNAGNRQTDGIKTYDMLLTEDGWSLVSVLAVNGAAQAHGYTLSIMGQKYM